MLRRNLAFTTACLFALATVGLSLPIPAAGAPITAARSLDLRLTRTVARSRPTGPLAASSHPGRAGAETAARQLVERIGGIPVAPAGQASNAELVDLVQAATGTCPSYRLEVSWTPPEGKYAIGGYLSPLGPPPDEHTTSVNGIVLCRDSNYAYLGFEALWDGSQWALVPVPSNGDDSHADATPTADTAAAPTPAQPTGLGAGTGVAPAAGTGWGPSIEDLAPYQPQSTCDPTPKPGVVGLRNLLLSSFPGSTDLGIGQACDAPDGVSEHKEGRAFDFGVNIANPAQRAVAEQVLAWLFAPDQYGNQYAMIRRLGIMYIIWDRHIWGAYAADQGWRDYGGVSPHTDHIHISFDWAGALGQTSFWTGQVGTVIPVGPVAGAVPPYVAPPVGGGTAVLASGPAGQAGQAGSNGAGGQSQAPGSPQSDQQSAPGSGQPAGSPQAATEPESDPGGSPSGGTTTTTSPPPTTTTTQPPPYHPTPPPTSPPPSSPPPTSPPPSDPPPTLLPPLPLRFGP